MYTIDGDWWRSLRFPRIVPRRGRGGVGGGGGGGGGSKILRLLQLANENTGICIVLYTQICWKPLQFLAYGLFKTLL